ncbi:GAF and ANTAR domain-containing protein [Subtercola sp. PAMC28395]|uniref:GAF and ANTAR domain-containing protein n=1 Tax=Subtercola sp. PAMC28395 TaxID=2846775 RepID=UPI001C0AB7B1|nr:GAF and ANTAR domain-containing protein [Subtercola sp. PAMC28395]QWT24487.1 GAF and ANTAR domain-containing protein [Subtercola sp. PAMC28395]
MDGTSREAQINAAFVAVADTLTTDYDMVDLLHTLVQECAGILGMKAGGLMLVGGDGELQLMTSTSEAAGFVEVMQLNAAAGPCIDCFRTGVAVSVKDIAAPSRWPAFQKAALDQGFHSVLATPMKLRGKIIGTMNLFGATPEEVTGRDAAVAQALADVATIGILQERIIREGHLMEEQLHRALDSRILIEQAKGVIANELTLSMDDAFQLLRKFARDHNLTIRSVAESVSNRQVSVNQIVATTPAQNRG